MINLGDYIGQVLGELTLARVNADLEAARVAELYSQHELLRHFPVPKIRLNNFDAEIRFLVVDSSGEITDENTINKIGGNFTHIATEVMRDKGIELDSDDKLRLAKLVDSRVREIKTSVTQRFDLPSLSSRFATIIEDVLKGRNLDQDTIREVRDEVDNKTRDSILQSQSSKPRLKVAVTSKELKEASAESITTLSLRASEEGLAWTQIKYDTEDGQSSSWRLVPE